MLFHQLRQRNRQKYRRRRRRGTVSTTGCTGLSTAVLQGRPRCWRREWHARALRCTAHTSRSCCQQWKRKLDVPVDSDAITSAANNAFAATVRNPLCQGVNMAKFLQVESLKGEERSLEAPPSAEALPDTRTGEPVRGTPLRADIAYSDNTQHG